MQDFGTKADNQPPPAGQLSAAEFNNYILELENIVSRSGQTLDGASVIQLAKAIGTGGRPISISNGGTAVEGDIVLPNNSAGPLTVNLPATPFTGARVYFQQVLGQPFSANALTLGRNGNTINNVAADVVIDINNLTFYAHFDGATWLLVFGDIIGVDPNSAYKAGNGFIADGIVITQTTGAPIVLGDAPFGCVVTDIPGIAGAILITLDFKGIVDSDNIRIEALTQTSILGAQPILAAGTGTDTFEIRIFENNATNTPENGSVQFSVYNREFLT